MTKKLAAVTSFAGYVFSAAVTFAQSPSGLIAPKGAVNPNINPTAVPQLVVNLLFAIAGFLAIAYLMYGGIKWITSRGDKVGVEAARKHIVAAVIGIIIVAGSFFALQTIFTILGAENPLKNGALPVLASPSPS
jgi:hypothetical protein